MALNIYEYPAARWGLAIFCLIGGFGIIGIWMGLFTMPSQGDESAPIIVLLIGLMFLLCAFSLIMGEHEERAHNILAVCILFTFGCAGVWVALKAESNQISGGVSYLPEDSNVLLGRIVFGIVGLLFLAVSALVFKKLIWPPTEGAE